MKRVLLTGATGFVGQHILNALLEKGCQIRVVVRTRSGDLLPPSTHIDIVETDDLFAEPDRWWETACADVETIIHAAWYAKPGRFLQAPENVACFEGTLALARGAVAARVRRFVGVGTCFEYDLSGGYLAADTPLRPTSIYARCKAAAYLFLSSCFELNEVSFAWCRLFYLYGDGEGKERLVPYLRDRLSAGLVAKLTSGTQIRDYLDAAEAGRLIVETALADKEGAVNICSGVPRTVRELAESIADEYGRRDLLRFGARQENLVDPPCVVGVKETAVT